MQIPDDDFLRYYLEELSYLRQMGERFARDYPKVAGRLELQPGTCPDPHVERLIEAFAFLTARIQSNLDNDFPEIATELLNVLYPHYLAPVPSMAIAQFNFDRDVKITTGFEIPRGTPLFAPAENAVCRMRTCYPVTLWPIEVTSVEMVSPENFEFLGNTSDAASVLRIRLESQGDSFEDLAVDTLRFFFSIPEHYELLHNDVRRVLVLREGDRIPRDLGENAVVPVGFAEEEEVIPYPRHSQPAYRLLTEYFTFPLKFQFADVRGLRGKATGRVVDLLFLLDRVPGHKMHFSPDTFQLGCTPVVNLFRKTSEPIRVDHRQMEYRLVADARKEKTTDIHSIVSVSGSSNASDRTREYAPFYSMNHNMRDTRKQTAFWHARRVPSARSDLRGYDVMLSFRDFEFRPSQPPEEVVFAHLLCTNRLLAREMSAGQPLQTDVAIPVSSINCVKKPTPQLAPSIGGQSLWRLVSHLSLNYLSLGEGDESLKALHEILMLYCYSDAPSARQKIVGIRNMAHRQVVRRILSGGDWRGFARGTEVTLTLDESHYVGTSPLLFATVLNAFFGLQASVNSFTQLIVHRAGREGEWKRWPPMVGGRAVL